MKKKFVWALGVQVKRTLWRPLDSGFFPDMSLVMSATRHSPQQPTAASLPPTQPTNPYVSK